MAACNNYRIMEPTAFADEQTMIRWSLQLMTGKAGAWAVRQMVRMDSQEELDARGRLPKELRKWEHFCTLFALQYGDPGEIERARSKWMGLKHKGRAVEYFEQVENLLLKLGYGRNEKMVIDQVTIGLKSHIRTHFIGTDWKTLNDMKADVIQYDSQYWQINHTQYGSYKKEGTNSNDKKSTPFQFKTEIAKNGTTDNSSWRLPQEDFEKCRQNRWCFKCYKEGKEIVGSGRFHPNHNKTQNSKTTDKNSKTTKIATTSTQTQDSKIQDVDTDSDSDVQSKN